MDYSTQNETKPGLSDSCEHKIKDQGAVTDLSNKQPTIMSDTTRREESNDWRRKAEQLETELRPILKENQRLRRCLGGVKVLGRALRESKQEVNKLRCLANDISPETRPRNTDDKDMELSQDVSYNEHDTIVTPPADLSANCEDDIDDGRHHLKQGIQQSLEFNGEMTSVEKSGNGQMKEVQQLDIGECSNQDKEDNNQRDKDSLCLKHSTMSVINQTHSIQPAEAGETQEDGLREDQMASEEIESVREAVSETSEHDSNSSGVTAVNIKIDDHEIDNLAEVEALLRDISSNNVPAQPASQPNEAVISTMRSVATVTDDRDSFVNSALAQQECSSLKIQVHELKKVNIEWDRYWKKKTFEFKAQLADKDRSIGKLKSQLDDVGAKTNMEAKHYDHTLLMAKTRIERTEEDVKLLKMELDQERQKSYKSEMLNRTLVKQNQNMTDEIIRLKEALERKYQQHVPMRKSPSPPLREPVIISSKPTKSPTAEVKEIDCTTFSGQHEARYHQTHAAPELAAFAPKPLKVPVDKESPIDTRPLHTKHEGDSSSRKKQMTKENIKNVVDKSLSKQEMKEQVELLRHQNRMYESDFNKEHAEREKAISELQTLRRELNKKKTRLQGNGHLHQMKERDGKKDALKISKIQGPKQGVYNPPAPIPSSVRQVHLQPETKPSQADGEVTVVKCSQNTTCKLINPKTIIIQTNPENKGLNIHFGGGVDTVRKKRTTDLKEPFQCPRCQKLFAGSEWESYEHHVALCNI